jgi:hypothetical protein
MMRPLAPFAERVDQTVAPDLRARSSSSIVELVVGRIASTRRARRAIRGGTMAARKKAARKAGNKSSGELIISKSRVKAATRKCNVGSEFYGALDAAVRRQIADAENRAMANKRKTLKPQDL